MVETAKVSSSANRIRFPVFISSAVYARPGIPGGGFRRCDVPKVLTFKAGVLLEHGMKPAAAITHIPIDLRDDWPGALVAASFDPTAPIAWLAEGLVPFLPADAQDSLLAHITQLSCPAR
ncbi:class I SAM-dependent methyltransferase [Mycobacterium sp. 1245852.3]|uniref:class I SAM-dependent methyltransferase n=1 Tax=Mycobacterium sp. 1245852.3 TaxID=1856860 RepID=UPI0009EE6A98|nr:class I SAM-dependent methyltransferase [Mycobacterium sp. 1245852.3]